MGLSTEDINHILKIHLDSDNFEFISCESTDSNHSMGYLSVQKKKCIRYTNHEKLEELYVFIKQIPESEVHRKNVIESGSFPRESLIYNEILADFQDYPIPVPKCYLGSESLIVLEDLSRIGFLNKSVYEPLDLLHCEKILESFAKFHAASFIIENEKGIKLNKLYPILETEVLLNPSDSHSGKRCCLTGIRAMKILTEKYLSNYPKDQINKGFDYMETVFDKLHSSKDYPNVLSHSDAWISNIMFKYNAEGMLEDVRIVDLQLTTYKPPSFDIQFLLHICTTKEFRANYCPQLMKFYYQSLQNQLSLSNINLDDIMSWSDFENMQKETLPLLLSIAPIYLQFVLMPTYILKDVLESDEKFKIYYEEDRTKNVLQAMEEHEHYKDRNLDALIELFEYFRQK